MISSSGDHRVYVQEVEFGDPQDDEQVGIFSQECILICRKVRLFATAATGLAVSWLSINAVPFRDQWTDVAKKSRQSVDTVLIAFSNGYDSE